MIEDFQDVLFPPHIGFSASRTIERYTEVQNFLSGREQRNGRKYHSKRKYSIGITAKHYDELAQITDFFEARRGALVGFKWHDILDYKSCPIADDLDANDQEIGVFDGSTLEFQLVKTYGNSGDEAQNYHRKITKPIASTLRIAVDGVELNGSLFFVDGLSGLVTILPSANMSNGDVISAGFEYNVPVRFAEMQLQIDYTAFKAGKIAQIPLIEILD